MDRAPPAARDRLGEDTFEERAGQHAAHVLELLRVGDELPAPREHRLALPREELGIEMPERADQRLAGEELDRCGHDSEVVDSDLRVPILDRNSHPQVLGPLQAVG